MGCGQSRPQAAEAPEKISTKSVEEGECGDVQQAEKQPPGASESGLARTDDQGQPQVEEEGGGANNEDAGDVRNNNATVKSAHEASVADMETRASSEEDAALRVEQIMDDALSDAREQLDEDEYFAAERTIMAAVEALQSRGPPGEAQLQKLREAEVYKKTLQQLRNYEHIVQEALSLVNADGKDDDDTPWRLAAEVEVDYQRLGMHVTPEAAEKLTDRTLTFYWRIKKDKTPQLRAGLSLPTSPSSADAGLNVMLAWLAMVTENTLHHTWNPVIVGDGATFLAPRTKKHIMWLVMFKVLILKNSNIEKLTLYANEETGGFTLRGKQALPKDDLWKAHPAPRGFSPSPSASDFTIVCLPQKHTTFFGGMGELRTDKPLPAFVVKFLATWLGPELIRRQLASAMKCLSPDSPYAPLIAEDRYGNYALTRDLIEAGSRNEEAGKYEGKTFSSHNVPRPEQITARAKSIVQFEDEALRSRQEASAS